MRRVKAALFLLALQPSQLSLSTSPQRGSAHPGEGLERRVHDYHLSGVNFVQALARVAGDFKIPMGIEWVKTPAAETKIDLSWKSATVEEVLQAIVQNRAGYRMAVTAGVVRISAPGLVPNRENPLKLRIDKFEVRSAPTESVSRQLHGVIKQTLYAAKSQTAGAGIAGSGASNLDDPRISVRLKDATVEDILDAIVLASARKIWIVTFSDAPGLTRSGSRRTLTLWNNFPISDTEQPVWDLMHWGEKVPA